MGQAKVNRDALERARRLARSHQQLVHDLEAQMRFLARSAAAYDAGDEDESRRMATVVRVLVHDTSNSESLLTQLRLLTHLRLLDSAAPYDPGNLIATIGLVQMQMTVNGDNPPSVIARYIAPLGDLPSDRQAHLSFTPWWTRPVARPSPDRPESTPASRRDLVLALVDREGGAHVDRLHDPYYRAIAIENGFGFVFKIGEDGVEQRVQGDPVAASVRQIAYEIETTLGEQLPRLLPEFFPPGSG